MKSKTDNKTKELSTPELTFGATAIDDLRYLKLNDPTQNAITLSVDKPVLDLNKIGKATDIAYLKINSATSIFEDTRKNIELFKSSLGDIKTLTMQTQSIMSPIKSLIKQEAKNMSSILSNYKLSDYSSFVPASNAYYNMPVIKPDQILPTKPRKLELSEKGQAQIEEAVARVLIKIGLSPDNIAEKLFNRLKIPQGDLIIAYEEGTLTINGRDVKITGPKEQMICEVIFRVPMSYKIWSWDEIVEGAGEKVENYDNKIIYRACYGLNKKISSITPYKDLLDYTTKNARINPHPTIVT